jgi:hypothetical protein
MPGPEDEKHEQEQGPAEADGNGLDDPMFPLPDLDLELSEGLEAEEERRED